MTPSGGRPTIVDAIQTRTATGGRHTMAENKTQPTDEDVEAFLIRKAVSRFGSVTEAAKALGLSRSALYRRLERYGIEP